MIDSLLKTLGERFSLSEQPTGEFGALKANGMKFTVRAFEAKGLGHVSVMQAKGFFGLMKMDTLIVNPLEKDLPLYSYDRIRMMSRDVLITELYDTLLAPRSFETLEAVKADYREFPDPDVEAHWYDSIKLKESFRKAGQKKVSARFDELTGRFFTAYLDAAPDASLRRTSTPRRTSPAMRPPSVKRRPSMWRDFSEKADRRPMRF